MSPLKKKKKNSSCIFFFLPLKRNNFFTGNSVTDYRKNNQITGRIFHSGPTCNDCAKTWNQSHIPLEKWCNNLSGQCRYTSTKKTSCNWKGRVGSWMNWQFLIWEACNANLFFWSTVFMLSPGSSKFPLYSETVTYNVTGKKEHLLLTFIPPNDNKGSKAEQSLRSLMKQEMLLIQGKSPLWFRFLIKNGFGDGDNLDGKLVT